MGRRADEGSVESSGVLPADGQAAHRESAVASATAKAVALRTKDIDVRRAGALAPADPVTLEDQSKPKARREWRENRRRLAERRARGAADRFRGVRVRQVERI